MGIFSRKKKLVSRPAQVLDPLPELEPVVLNLDNNRLTYVNGRWTADFAEGPIYAPDGSLEKEAIELRREQRKLWTMRVLDNERSAYADKEGILSPGRASRRSSVVVNSY